MMRQESRKTARQETEYQKDRRQEIESRTFFKTHSDRRPRVL